MNKINYAKYIAECRKQYEGKPCEACGKQHDHSYATGRFCSKSCAYAYKKTKGASPKLRAHLDKLRAEGKVSKKAPYGTWKCPHCSIICETARQLETHISEVHKQASSGLSHKDKHFVCQYCGKVFDNRFSAMAHLSSCKLHPNKEMHDRAHKQAGITAKLLYKEHPEKHGFFGKHLTAEHKQKLSNARVHTLQNECLDKPYAYIKWLKVRNIKNEEFSVRGHWEENVALQLNKLGIYWIKSQPLKYFDEYWHNYTPDFYVPSLDVYVEVKGRYPDTDRKKMKLVVKYHPDKKIYFIHDQYHDFISGKCAFDDNLLISPKDL